MKGNRGFFFFFSFFLYIIYSLLRYKKSYGALAMAKTKPKIQNKQIKGIPSPIIFKGGSVQVPSPPMAAKIKQVNQGNPPTTSRYYKQLEQKYTT